MSMSPQQSRALREIGEHLRATDPRLARRLTWARHPPTSAARESMVIAVLIHWEALGFVPLGLGVEYSLPVLVGVGVLTTFVGGPVMIWATLRWVRRRAFVRFREIGEQ
jgi:hypothetical protein